MGEGSRSRGHNRSQRRGLGTLDTKLEALTSYDYNLFVVAARKTEKQAQASPPKPR